MSNLSSEPPGEPRELESRIRALEELVRAGGVPASSGSSAGRLRRPRGRVVASLLAALLALAPVSLVLAHHVFPDVSDGLTHSEAIERIAEAGITAGCGGTVNYCPEAPVTRAQMATFLHRSLGRVSMGPRGTSNTISVVAGVESSLSYHIGDVEIWVPGASNSFTPNQFVKIEAVVEIYDSLTTAKGCECSFVLMLRDFQPTRIDPYPIAADTFRATAAGVRSWGLSGVGVFPVAPGYKSYQVWVAMYDRVTTTAAATFEVYLDQAVATTFPFGYAGGNGGSFPVGPGLPAFRDRAIPPTDPSEPRQD